MNRIFLLMFMILFFIPKAYATNFCTNGNFGAGYLFNEASGSAIDCTGNGNTGTVGSAVVQHVTGEYSFAYSFPSDNNALVYATPAASINALANVSFGAWIKPTTSGSAGNKCTGASIITKTDGAHGPEVCVNSDGSIEFVAWWSGGAAVWKSSTTPVQFNSTFQHIVVTYSYSSTGNNPIIYYNGTPTGVTNLSGAFGSQVADSSNPLVIGNEYQVAGVGQNGKFDGVIDEPFIANVILSSTDISNIINHGIDGTQSSAAHTNFFNSVLKNAVIH